MKCIAGTNKGNGPSLSCCLISIKAPLTCCGLCRTSTTVVAPHVAPRRRSDPKDQKSRAVVWSFQDLGARPPTL